LVLPVVLLLLVAPLLLENGDSTAGVFCPGKKRLPAAKPAVCLKIRNMAVIVSKK
jgi:hypothetical protein